MIDKREIIDAATAFSLNPHITEKDYDPRQSRAHERPAQPDDIADNDAAAFVQEMGRDFYRSYLEVEQFVAEVCGDAKLVQAGPCFL